MPKNKRPARSRTTDLKNQIRGTSGASYSIAGLKYTARRSDLDSIIKWIRNSYPLSPYFDGLFPKSPAFIEGLSISATRDFGDELAWSISILKSEHNKLAKYIEYKDKLESCLNDDDYHGASIHLDSITDCVGWSHLTLGVKCLIVGKIEGLEAQKKWIKDNVFDKIMSPAVFFCYFAGMRTEPDAEPLAYEKTVQNFRNNTSDLEEKIFLDHFLLGVPSDTEAEAVHVRQLQTQSIVDIYEGLVSLASIAAAEVRDTSTEYYNNFIPFMGLISDGRATGIKAAMGDGGALHDLRSIGSEWSPSQHQDHVRNIQNESTTLVPKKYDELARLVCDHSLTDKDARTQLGNLTYSIIWSRFCQFAATTYKLRSAQSLDDILRQYRLRFIHDRALNPLLTGTLHPDVITTHIDPETFSDSDISRRMFSLGQAITQRNYPQIIKQCSKLVEHMGAEDPELLRLEIVALLEQDSVSEITQRLYPFAVGDSVKLQWLPFTRLSSIYTDEVISRYGADPKTAVVISSLVGLTGEKTRGQLIYAIEQFLQSTGCEKASELDPNLIADNPAIKYLILNGCKMETLALSLNYLDGEDVQSERIAELRLLMGVDNKLEERCLSEIEEIVRTQEIANAIDKLKTGKIDCDENQIQAWANENLSSKFDRFRAFVDAGILPTTPGLSSELLVAIREGNPSAAVFEVPKNDSTAIIQEIVGDLIFAYSFDPAHGLNSYLSLRVRHGTVSGQLRRACAEERLLTTADGDGDRYESNHHWFEILQEFLPVGKAIQIANQLGEFSRDFDAAISDLISERIQILSKSKPNGIISTAFTEPIKYSFFSEAIKFDKFDEFLASFSTLFWTNLERNLETARHYLDSEFKLILVEKFDLLEAKVSKITGYSRFPPLSDAITRARLATSLSIDEMLEWFRGSRPVDTDPFPIADLARISLEMVKRLNPDFYPNISIVGDTDFVAVSALFVITDVFFVLFDNAQKHSGFKKPDILIQIHVLPGDLLRIEFSSSCADIETAQSEAKKANEMIDAGRYTTGLSAEGGTGLAKIAKIVANSTSSRPLRISVDEGSQRFCVSMDFSYVDLGQDKFSGEVS